MAGPGRRRRGVGEARRGAPESRCKAKTAKRKASLFVARSDGALSPVPHDPGRTAHPPDAHPAPQLSCAPGRRSSLFSLTKDVRGRLPGGVPSASKKQSAPVHGPIRSVHDWSVLHVFHVLVVVDLTTKWKSSIASKWHYNLIDSYYDLFLTARYMSKNEISETHTRNSGSVILHWFCVVIFVSKASGSRQNVT